MAQQHDDSWRDQIGRDSNGGAGANAERYAGNFDGEKTRMLNGDDRWKNQEAERNSRASAARERQREKGKGATGTGAREAAGADRWAEEQMFEEDVRTVLMLMRPNRRERLLGWNEYRTGGSHFRATVSWDDEFEMNDGGRGQMRIPNMTDVLEAILVGSARHDDDLLPAEEFEIYRNVVRELYRRLDDLQSCYE